MGVLVDVSTNPVVDSSELPAGAVMAAPDDVLVARLASAVTVFKYLNHVVLDFHCICGIKCFIILFN